MTKGICHYCKKEYELDYIEIKYTINNSVRKLYCSASCKEACPDFHELMGGDFRYKGLRTKENV